VKVAKLLQAILEPVCALPAAKAYYTIQPGERPGLGQAERIVPVVGRDQPAIKSGIIHAHGRDINSGLILSTVQR